MASPRRFWYDALDAPSAVQMGHLRRLLESVPFATLQPDLSLLAFEQTVPWEMCLALRGEGVARVYTPTGRTLEVHLGKLPGGKLDAAWFDPRTGTRNAIGESEDEGRRVFDPPGEEQSGNDWALILERIIANP